MENLKALVYKGDLTPYQRALAKREFEGMRERLELLEKAVKNNAVLPHVSVSVCSCEMPAKVKGKNECWRCKRPLKEFLQTER